MNPLYSPTAVKFHQQWNLREMSRVIEGLLQSQPGQQKGDMTKFLRLWVHECRRVFEDRLISMDDVAGVDAILEEAFKGFEGAEKDEYLQNL